MNIPSLTKGEPYQVIYRDKWVFIGECVETETRVFNPSLTFKILIWLSDQMPLLKDPYILTAYEIQNLHYNISPIPIDELPLYIFHKGVRPYLEEYMRTKTF